MGHQRDGAPPEEWEPRRDHDARAVVRAVRKEVASVSAELEDFRKDVEHRLKSYVGWTSVIGAAVALVALVVNLTNNLNVPLKESVAQIRQEIQSLKAELARRDAAGPWRLPQPPPKEDKP